MFAIIKTEDGSWVAKEGQNPSALDTDIELQLRQNQPVVLVMTLEDAASIGIDPTTITMDGEPTVKKEPAPAEPMK